MISLVFIMHNLSKNGQVKCRITKLKKLDLQIVDIEASVHYKHYFTSIYSKIYNTYIFTSNLENSYHLCQFLKHLKVGAYFQCKYNLRQNNGQFYKKELFLTGPEQRVKQKLYDIKI